MKETHLRSGISKRDGNLNQPRRDNCVDLNPQYRLRSLIEDIEVMVQNGGGRREKVSLTGFAMGYFKMAAGG